MTKLIFKNKTLKINDKHILSNWIAYLNHKGIAYEVKVMSKVIFELTIPKSGSWNGKFSGSNNKYTIRKTLGRGSLDIIGKNFWYDWGDGWSANVKVRLPELREKVINKFMGYEWMIDSIIKNKKILKPTR